MPKIVPTQKRLGKRAIMKKAGLICAAILAALSLSACGNQAENKAASPKKARTSKVVKHKNRPSINKRLPSIKTKRKSLRLPILLRLLTKLLPIRNSSSKTKPSSKAKRNRPRLPSNRRLATASCRHLPTCMIS